MYPFYLLFFFSRVSDKCLAAAVTFDLSSPNLSSVMYNTLSPPLPCLTAISDCNPAPRLTLKEEMVSAGAGRELEGVVFVGGAEGGSAEEDIICIQISVHFHQHGIITAPLAAPPRLQSDAVPIEYCDILVINP